MIRYNEWLDKVERRESYRGDRSDNIRHDMSERIFSFNNKFFEDLVSEIDQISTITYPSRYEYQALKKRIAVQNGVSEDQVMITPGSDSALRIIFEAFCTKGKRVITTDPCFPMYDVYALINGSTIDKVNYEEDLTFSIKSILSSINAQTRLVVLSNPSSPIGDYKSIDEIEDLCSKLEKKGIALVIDEAYYEFAPGTAVSLTNKFENIVITRTMSKACGLAGMRVGYLIASPMIYRILDKLRLAFPLTSASTRFATKVFENIHIVKSYASETIMNRDYLSLALRNTSIDIINTHSNWVHINCPDNNSMLEKIFDSKGISTRFGTSIPFDNRDNWLRLTVGPKMINRSIVREIIELGGKFEKSNSNS